MITSISAAVTSVQAALSALETAIKARDFIKANDKLLETSHNLSSAWAILLDSQAKVHSLQTKVTELEQENARLRDWRAEMPSYTLTEIAVGVFAYVHRDNVKPFQSAQKLCCGCYEKSIKTTLQSVPTLSGVKSSHSLSCANNCPTLTFLRYKDHSPDARS